jgi:eukaryotic-like serine/threonine-protein kinase
MPRTPPPPPAPEPNDAHAGVAALLTGTPYELVRLLKRGGMGEVWAIKHGFLGRQFALKVLHPHLAADADRMRVEAETMGRLNNPHVVEVVDFWLSPQGRPCIVMELLNGRTLWEELIERKQLPTPEALDVTRQILVALVAAHSLGVVHRDLKPENIFLHQARGFGCVTKVLDFGIARILPNAPPTAPDPSALRTITGAVMGSPRYMSPEAWNGERLDARADVYAVGVMLYVMLTGHGPFDTDQPQPTPPSRLNAEVPSELDAIVLQAIREDVATRIQSAQEFLDAIEPWLRRLGPGGRS